MRRDVSLTHSTRAFQVVECDTTRSKASASRRASKMALLVSPPRAACDSALTSPVSPFRPPPRVSLPRVRQPMRFSPQRAEIDFSAFLRKRIAARLKSAYSFCGCDAVAL